MSRISFTHAQLPARKRIALVAHDHCKGFLLDWCERQRDKLARHELVATGTTGLLLSKRLDLPVESMISGPLGGDQQIGARIAEQRVDMLVFFWDPSSHSHTTRISRHCCVWRRCGTSRSPATRAAPTTCSAAACWSNSTSIAFPTIRLIWQRAAKNPPCPAPP